MAELMSQQLIGSDGAKSDGSEHESLKGMPYDASAHFIELQNALLNEDRLKALRACDEGKRPYNSRAFSIVFSLRGRNFLDFAPPLVIVTIWSIVWAAIITGTCHCSGVFLAAPEDHFNKSDLRDSLLPLQDLLGDSLSQTIGFLLVFRLGRSAIRYWEGRAATGKMVEACREVGSQVCRVGHSSLPGLEGRGDLMCP